jgi:hypothetical protein
MHKAWTTVVYHMYKSWTTAISHMHKAWTTVVYHILIVDKAKILPCNKTLSFA